MNWYCYDCDAAGNVEVAALQHTKETDHVTVGKTFQFSPAKDRVVLFKKGL